MNYSFVHIDFDFDLISAQDLNRRIVLMAMHLNAAISSMCAAHIIFN